MNGWFLLIKLVIVLLEIKQKLRKINSLTNCYKVLTFSLLSVDPVQHIVSGRSLYAICLSAFTASFQIELTFSQFCKSDSGSVDMILLKDSSIQYKLSLNITVHISLKRTYRTISYWWLKMNAASPELSSSDVMVQFFYIRVTQPYNK